jgi:hypothetical protein
MLKNGSLQTGDVYLKFNGRDSYVEIPGIADYSASKGSSRCPRLVNM